MIKLYIDKQNINDFITFNDTIKQYGLTVSLKEYALQHTFLRDTVISNEGFMDKAKEIGNRIMEYFIKFINFIKKSFINVMQIGITNIKKFIYNKEELYIKSDFQQYENNLLYNSGIVIAIESVDNNIKLKNRKFKFVSDSYYNTIMNHFKDKVVMLMIIINDLSQELKNAYSQMSTVEINTNKINVCLNNLKSAMLQFKSDLVFDVKSLNGNLHIKLNKKTMSQLEKPQFIDKLGYKQKTDNEWFRYILEPCEQLLDDLDKLDINLEKLKKNMILYQKAVEDNLKSFKHNSKFYDEIHEDAENDNFLVNETKKKNHITVKNAEILLTKYPTIFESIDFMRNITVEINNIMKFLFQLINSNMELSSGYMEEYKSKILNK